MLKFDEKKKSKRHHPNEYKFSVHFAGPPLTKKN